MIHHRPRTLPGQGFKGVAFIGGWYSLQHYCSEIGFSQDRRAIIITSAKSFFTQYNIAGMDIDWEFPRSALRDKQEDYK